MANRLAGWYSAREFSEYIAKRGAVERIAAYKGEVLGIYGELELQRDQWARESLESLRSSGATTAVITDAGHTRMIDQPEQVLEVLVPFLSRTTPRAAN